ncbi:hypothetical protein BT69DRAFT_1331609 [Atractiella rhizophila]|nr:hypothetical protein BT69DRAFT_1331609 [Atractiella rhizophila]
MATARLKRKLDDLDVGNLNESFCVYGTPLPSLADTKKDSNEFVPIWKQEVKDEKGRRRFHGAFTGGFSAGYFNTVGSEEGWAPSTFISSRHKEKTQAQQSTSELARSYMDEEDLADLSASRTLQQTSTFSTYDPLSGIGGPAPSTSTVEGALHDLIRPAKSSIGHELMKKMGWREGQGVGPRVSLKRRREQAVEYGVARAEEGVEDVEMEEEDAEGKKKGFAPLNRPVFNFDDIGVGMEHGLGWAKGQSLDQTLGRDDEKVEEMKRKMPVGGAWGLGALEDADMDDGDVYDDAPGLSGQKAGMMIVEEDDEPSIVTLSGLDRREKEERRKKQKEREKQQDHRKREVLKDGTQILNGFVLAKRVEKPDVWPAPPPVPKDWKPNPQAVWDRDPTRKAGLEDKEKDKAMNDPKRPANLTADQRGELFGEQKLPEMKKSVFDYISAANKSRIESLKTAHQKGIFSSDTSPSERVIIPEMDPQTASLALKGFIPYSDDKAKQSRYLLYLQVMSGLRSRSEVSFVPVTKKDGVKQTVAELNKELEDFERSAKVFKPATGMMANRFTSAKEVIMPGGGTEESKVGLYQPTAEERQRAIEKAAEPVQRIEEEETPLQNAARMGMWGPLTRETKVFYPDRLLCKRFGVANPHPDGPVAEPEERTSKLDEMLMEKGYRPMPKEEKGAPLANVSAEAFPVAKTGERRTLANVGLGEDETQGANTLTYERPSMDIFKAIFADSEDEDEDDEKENSPTPLVADREFKSQVNDLLQSEAQKSQPLVKSTVLTLADATKPEADVQPGNEDITVVEPLNFRPTFVSRKQRNESTGGAEEAAQDKKKKKKKKAVLSFDVEDGEDVGPSLNLKKMDKKDKKRKKGGGEDEHRKKKRRKEEEEDEEWVEKEVQNACNRPHGLISESHATFGKMED